MADYLHFLKSVASKQLNFLTVLFTAGQFNNRYKATDSQSAPCRQ